MKVIHKFSEFRPSFLGNKGKTTIVRSQNLCTTLIQTLLRKIEQICEVLLIGRQGQGGPPTKVMLLWLGSYICLYLSDKHRRKN